jgi:hypothetical protein
MVDNEILREFDGTLNLRPIIKPLAIVAGTAVVTLFGSMWIVSKLYATRSFDNIALRQEMNSKDGYTGVASGLESQVGCTVTVFTDMRPGGKVMTQDGKIIEATLKFGGFASKGTKLKVLHAEQGRLYCDAE